MLSFVKTEIKIIILSFIVVPAMADEIKNPVFDLIKAKVAQHQLKSSPVFEGRGDGITTCPVTGEKVHNKSLKAEFNGRMVYFCCHGCLKAAKRIPDKFVKPTQEEQAKAVKAYLANAKPIDSAEFCQD